MSRRPRGTCPVCRNTLSLCWSGEIRVLRKHSSAAEPCAGSGRPAVGEAEVADLFADLLAEQSGGRRSAPAAERVASVA